MSVYLGMENVLASNVTVIYICIKIILNCRKDINYFQKNPPKATVNLSKSDFEIRKEKVKESEENNLPG